MAPSENLIFPQDGKGRLKLCSNNMVGEGPPGGTAGRNVETRRGRVMAGDGAWTRGGRKKEKISGKPLKRGLVRHPRQPCFDAGRPRRKAVEWGVGKGRR